MNEYSLFSAKTNPSTLVGSEITVTQPFCVLCCCRVSSSHSQEEDEGDRCVFACRAWGQHRPSSHVIKDILASVGAEAEDGMIELLLSEVKGKDIAEVIAAGREKLASVPCGGGAAVAVSAAPGGGSGSAAAPAAAEAKKEEKVEEKEESDDDMGFSLFD